ncbi:hypothetical protein ACFPAG_08000 [Vogesella sp. GCM10023246]|uniref:Uncharacterized protein n=1 Tax=Vogesella oryzagri TaxID=3160864 RepID=A0ABV1M6J0_9NEIS
MALASLAVMFTFRGAAVAAATWLLASLSATAMASSGAGKAGAAAGLHGPAFIGALFGAALQWRQSLGRPTPERVLLAAVSLVAAYFGGLLTASLWPDLGGGAVGLGGLVAANLAVPLIDALRALLLALRDALLALLRDVPWLKRLIANRLGAKDAASQLPSTETVDKPVNDSAAG